MSIDMYLSKSKDQASSVATMADSQVLACEQALAAITNFASSSEELKGEAYDSARNYFATLLTPLAKAATLVAEEVKSSVQSFPDTYETDVDTGDLKESELEDQIESLESSISQEEEAFKSLGADTSQSPLPIEEKIASLKDSKQELENKLNNLRTFDQTSPSLFNGVDELKASFDTGLGQANQAWNATEGTFVLPPFFWTDNGIEWAENIQERWEDRDATTVRKLAREAGLSKGIKTVDWVAERAPYVGAALRGVRGISYYASAPTARRPNRFDFSKRFDQNGDLVLGKRFITLTQGDHKIITRIGRRLEEITGDKIEDLTQKNKISISRLVSKAKFATSHFKSAVNVFNDFKGWKDASKLVRTIKGAGIVGTGISIFNNAAKVDFSDGIQGIEARDFVIDTGVDLVSGATAATIGATVGSFLLPPLGTVTGALVGFAVHEFANNKRGNPPRSAVDYAKDGVKGAADAVGDIASRAGAAISSWF